MTRSRLWRGVLAALVCAGLAQGAAAAADPLRITAPVNATKFDLDPLRTWGGPSLAVHPSNGNIIVAGMHEYRDKTCGVMVSRDAGATWELRDAIANPTNYPYCTANNSNVYQANIAFGRDARLYMAMVGWDLQDTRSKASIVVAYSDDLGESWTTKVVHDARPTADPNQVSLRPITGLTIDTRSGSRDTVVVSYRLQFQNQTPGNAKPVEPYVAVSTDAGETFTTHSALAGAFDNPATVSAKIAAATTVPPTTGGTVTTLPAGSFGATPTNPMNFGASTNGHGSTIDGDGNIYVAWASQSSNSATLGAQPRGVFVSKSTDKGQTFTVTQVDAFSVKNRGNNRIAWGPGGGSNGTLYMVWEQSSRPEVNSYSEVVLSRSTDGGATWTAPQSVADDPPSELAGKYIPMVSVAPNGRVDITWWDTRDDPGIRANDVYYTYSTDAGATWSENIRVTDQTIDRRFGVWGNNFDQNAPPSIASADRFAFFGWDDTRFSRPDGNIVANDPTVEGEGIGGGVQDVFVSAVQFTELGGGTSSTAKAILAGVIGLVAVGLVLLVVGGVGRRSGGGSPVSGASKQATKVG